MIRGLAMVGMGGGFLLISPALRENVGFGITAVTEFLNDYSPFSYIAATIGIVALLTLSLHNAGTKR
jgi:hypothetical protein